MKKLIYTLLLILTSAVCFSNGNNIHTIYSFAKTQSDTIFMVSVKGDKVTKINGKPDWLSMADILNYEKQMKSSI